MDDYIIGEGWIILQAVAKKTIGIKGDGLHDNFMKVYATKEDAKDFLMKVIRDVQKGIRAGLRSTDNLDKEKSLDWLIEKITLRIPTKNMKHRGWEIPHNNDS